MDKIDCEVKISEMMDQYQNLVLSICYKLTQDYVAAQDLTQETFLSAYRHLETFNGENEKAWLCRIASNKCIDYLRMAQRLQIPTQDSDLENFHSTTGRPEHEALEAGIRRELQENCRKLKPPYDEIAYQYFYLEKKPEEIARSQKKNLKTVRTQIYRARDMMRRLYRREQADGKEKEDGR